MSCSKRVNSHPAPSGIPILIPPLAYAITFMVVGWDRQDMIGPALMALAPALMASSLLWFHEHIVVSPEDQSHAALDAEDEGTIVPGMLSFLMALVMLLASVVIIGLGIFFATPDDWLAGLIATLVVIALVVIVPKIERRSIEGFGVLRDTKDHIVPV